jgi:hypothetical protein
VVVGTHAAFTGRFVQHAKFGLQFEVLAVSQSTHADEIVRLVSSGIPAAIAAHAVALFGVDAERELRRDPYQLCRAGLGVAFREVELLAINVLALPAGHVGRLQRAITTVLEMQMGAGHCYMLQTTVIANVLEMLKLRSPARTEIAAVLDDASFEDAEAPFRVYTATRSSQSQVQLEQFAAAEDMVAGKVAELLAGSQL